MPKSTTVTKPRPTIGVKYPPELEKRIHAVSSELTRRAAGVPLPITNVMVAITTKGLDAIEAELEIAKPSKSTKVA